MAQRQDIVGDDDGRIGHFLNYATMLPSPLEIKTSEQYCCPLCPSSDSSEDSIRDRIQNRRGALLGWYL
ncbi:hypothetical protein J7M23_10250, partial [Candidatus Sumerlaeota bacterium]|nr:hypothetical protein [Candidatus Sumerlaeota bacterium]